MVDIHSHILPSMDDGAKNTNESLKILKELKKQGVTNVFATPHFYPQTDDASDFNDSLQNSYKKLCRAINDKSVPNIHLGCELLYFEGIRNSDSLSQFCLANSSYLLLELAPLKIKDKLLQDILFLRDEKKIIPIIAHIERYSYAKNFRKLLKFIETEKILTQINASSLFERKGYKTVKKLIKKDIVTFIATDTHSIDNRPPMMMDALRLIEKKFGEQVKAKLIENGKSLLQKILEESKANAKNEQSVTS